jgi:hypothetical protein
VAASDSDDCAFLVQLSHRAGTGTPVAAVCVASAAGEQVREVRAAPDDGDSRWRRVVVRFPARGEPARLEVLATGEAALTVGCISFWKRCARPLWLIGHMCNSPAIIAQDLADGANAVECDVGARGGDAAGALQFFHGFVPPYFRRSAARTSLHELVAECRRRLDELSLVVLDCRELDGDDPDYRTFGRRLAEAVREQLPAERVLVSITEPSMTGVFDGLDDAGFAAGRDLSNAPQAWGGRATALGIGTDPFTPFDFVGRWIGKVAAAVDARDRGAGAAKVWYWTLTSRESMREILDLAVDGLLVNRPAVLRALLDEEPYRHLYRIATPSDSQFRVHGRGSRSLEPFGSQEHHGPEKHDRESADELQPPAA